MGWEIGGGPGRVFAPYIVCLAAFLFRVGVSGLIFLRDVFAPLGESVGSMPGCHMCHFLPHFRIHDLCDSHVCICSAVLRGGKN